MVSFSAASSSIGNGGKSLYPSGVHRRNTSSPKNASLANLQLSIPACDTLHNLLYLASTSSAGLNCDLSITMADCDRSDVGVTVGVAGSSTDCSTAGSW